MRVCLPVVAKSMPLENRELGLHEPGPERVVAADTAQQHPAVVHLGAGGVLAARNVLVGVGEVEGEVPALEVPAHGGRPLRVLGGEAARSWSAGGSGAGPGKKSLP